MLISNFKLWGWDKKTRTMLRFIKARDIFCFKYVPTDMDGIYFTYGEEPWCKKVDIWGNKIPISEQEAESLPRVSPFGDYNIKELLKDI